MRKETDDWLLDPRARLSHTLKPTQATSPLKRCRRRRRTKQDCRRTWLVAQSIGA